MIGMQTKVLNSGFFAGNGLHAIVDGQYGSTGKGLLASFMAEIFGNHPDVSVTSNAGPNSGHTFYWRGQKIVLRQLPSFGVYQSLESGGRSGPIYMNAGAIIDPEILVDEVTRYLHPNTTVYLHPMAAVVTDETRETEEQLVDAIGSTGKGTGAALASKVMRRPNSTVGSVAHMLKLPSNLVVTRDKPNAASDKVLMEVSQGYSLSLNAGGFYPHCTSRDCTVGAAMSDAGLHPRFYRSCAMVVRTFPIRVAGNSGGCYPDQKEISWNELGQTPERTTVTNKVRRVFTWSVKQFMDACEANRPDLVMVNFMNYLDPSINHDGWLLKNVYAPYTMVMGTRPTILLGYGPKNEDVRVWGAAR